MQRTQMGVREQEGILDDILGSVGVVKDIPRRRQDRPLVPDDKVLKGGGFPASNLANQFVIGFHPVLLPGVPNIKSARQGNLRQLICSVAEKLMTRPRTRG